MKLSIDKKAQLAKALATLAEKDPEGKFFDLLNGSKIPKTPQELTDADRLALAKAETKRAVRAAKRVLNSMQFLPD